MATGIRASQLYRRRAALTIGGVTIIGAAPQDELNAFRVQISVKTSLEGKGNSAKCTIFNLSPSTRGLIEEAATKASGIAPTFVIQAGYPKTLSAVFIGKARSVKSTFDMPGWRTEISANDGTKTQTSVMNRTLSPGSVLADAFAAIQQETGLNATKAIADARAGRFQNSTVKKFTHGLSMHGPVGGILVDLAVTYGFEWLIRDDELTVFPAGAFASESQLFLSEDTGLVGRPSRIVDPKRPGKFLYQLKCLMTAEAVPGRTINVASNFLNETIKAVKVEHSGDTHGSEWFTTIEGERLPT
jgi:hypothetical protein